MYYFEELEKDERNASNKTCKVQLLNFLYCEKLEDFVTSISPQIVSIYALVLFFSFCLHLLYWSHESGGIITLLFILLIGVVLLGVLSIIFLIKLIVFKIFDFFPRLKNKFYRKIRLPIKYYLLVLYFFAFTYNALFFYAFFDKANVTLFCALVFLFVAFACYFYLAYEKQAILCAKMYLLFSLFAIQCAYIYVLFPFCAG